MEASRCLQERKSIRVFKPEPVPRALLEEVLELARWSPSYKNSQPWEVVVLSGEQKEALSREMIRLLEANVPKSADLAAPQSWPPTQEANISQLYTSRQEATGVDLQDPQLIKKTKKANFSFYGAPHAIYLFQDNSLSQWSLFDLGLFAQSLMLAAHSKGLGTVPQAFATDYAREIKEFLAIPAGKRLVLGLSLGYPDPEASLNKLRTERMEVEKFVRWLE